MEWQKLKTYSESKEHSFEELCYQIAKYLYSDKGVFTSIDDSGGGDGVEFYLTFPNEEQWGWQAKYYYPQLRLSEHGRKTHIKNSLKTSCEKHPKLTKWFLCTPTNFTPGEQNWFNTELKGYIPEKMKVSLEHWSDSDFNDYLTDPNLIGKKLNFFGELELGLQWFKEKCEIQIETIRGKFNNVLHTETKTDFYIHSFLADGTFKKYIDEKIDSINGKLNEFKEAAADVGADSIFKQVNLETKSCILKGLKQLEETLNSAISELIQSYNSKIIEHYLKKSCLIVIKFMLT
jgi:hypothetical protein